MLLSQRQNLANRGQAIAESFSPATVTLIGQAAVDCFSTTPNAGHRMADDGSGLVPTFRIYIRILKSLVNVAIKSGQSILVKVSDSPARLMQVESANAETAETHWRIVCTSPVA